MPVLAQSPMQFVENAVPVSVRNILLATDFSEASRKAGGYAKALAKRFDARLEIANIFNPSVVTSYEEAILTMTPAQMQEISEENLLSFASGLKLDGIETQLVSEQDHNASTALLAIANRHRADLIVAGTEARSGLSRLILGSTAEQLLRWAGCPVLTVGPNARTPKEGPLEFKTIVYATDLSPEAKKAASIAVVFAEDCASYLYCCCVLSPSDEGLKTRAQLKDEFVRGMKKLVPAGAYDWCNPEFVVEYGDAAKTILRFADEVNADLIVVGARRASFWLTRVEGGLTPALLAHARCPVLTVS